MVLNKSNFLKILLFFIYPISVLPVIIKDIEKSRLNILLFSTLLGMFAFLTIPLHNDDLATHYYIFEDIKGMSLDEFKIFLLFQSDYFLQVLSYSFSNLGISKQFIPFIAVFISYYLKLEIFIDFYKDKLYNKIGSILLLIIILAIDYRGIVLGIRNGLAVSVLIYGIYLLFINNNRKGWFFVVFSSIIHSMTLIVIPLILISGMNLKSNIYRNIFLASFLFLFIGSSSVIINLLNFPISFLPFNIINKIEVYTEGYWALEYLDDQSFKAKTALLIRQLLIFSIYIYLILIPHKSKLRNLIYLIGSFANILFVFPNLFGRYSHITLGIFIIILLYEYNKPLKKNMLILLYYISIVVVFNFIGMIYSMRHSIILSYPKMIYQTSVSVFLNEVKEEDYIVKKN